MQILVHHVREARLCVARVTARRRAVVIDLLLQILGSVPDEDPSPMLRERFRAALAGFAERGEAPVVAPAEPVIRHGRMSPFRRYLAQAAAAVLVAATAFMGGRLSVREPEIAELRGEVSALRELVTASVVDRSSAATRIEGLNLARQVESPDDDLLSLLLVTLNSDPNVNVRLAAVGALGHYPDNEWLRGELVESLAVQTSPLVQISMIELLVTLRERRAVGVFRALSEREGTLDAVRKSALWGMQQMI